MALGEMMGHKETDLTDEQKRVLFDKATEAPFTGKFLHSKDTGMYTCANCGHELFNSDSKFSAPPPNEGWPSFSDVAKAGSVKLVNDNRYGMERKEVICANCEGHLGHFFDDGPAEADGKHFCINSVCLDFKPTKNK